MWPKMKNKLIIHIPTNNTEERLYAIKVLIKNILGLEYTIEINCGVTDTYICFGGKTICIKDHFFGRYTQPLSYLSTENMPTPKYFSFIFSSEEITPVLYGNDECQINDNNIICGIDIIASAYFMLSRWEEYADKRRDEHNRFVGKYSTAYNHNFLHRPIVNEYATIIWNMLKHLNFDGKAAENKFECHITHDIDILRSNSRLKSMIGDMVKRHDIKLALSRLLPPYTDTANTYDFLMTQSESIGKQSTFYFMAADYRPEYFLYEGYLHKKKFKRLIAEIKQRQHIIGFHPGYNTCTSQRRWSEQKTNLEKASDTKITLCRQHFLQIEIPYTFNILEQNHISHDSTLGYPDCEGFRCGTGNEFNVFDFLNRKELNVKERPLIIMDTCIRNQNLTMNETEKIYTHYIDICKKYNTPITILFHNSSFDNYHWKGWRELYTRIITQLK